MEQEKDQEKDPAAAEAIHRAQKVEDEVLDNELADL